MGLCCACLSAPVLLLMFAGLVAWLQQLRIRLMAVLMVATLVPLVILSVVLVRVLETGHESGLQGGMQQAVAAASQRLGRATAGVVGIGEHLAGTVDCGDSATRTQPDRRPGQPRRAADGS